MLRLATLALALTTSAQATEMTPTACAAQTYSPEALRYEMEGSVQLAFTLDKDGMPVEPRVQLSSGYGLLNRDTIAHIRSCRFAADGAAGAQHTMTVHWRLPQGSPEAVPRFLPQSCLNKYKALTPASPGPDYLTVRMQVWPDGHAYTPKIEQSSGEPELDKLAENYVENCRFVPAQRDGKSAHGAILLTLPVDRTIYAEDKVHIQYDRIVARLSQIKDYKVAHILYATEAAAQEGMAALRSGQPFGALARQQSMDKASGKVDGELGWLRVSDVVTAFAAAMQAQDKPDLIGKPVHTPFGWHIVQIREIRPAAIPSYEIVRDRLRSTLLKETDIVVQRPPAAASNGQAERRNE